MNINKKNLLIILGAGASKSLDDSMPLGVDLITEIKEYKQKSIKWLIAYLLYKFIDESPYFKMNDDQIYNESNFFIFVDEVIKFLPQNNSYYTEEEKVKVLSMFNSNFSKYFDEENFKKWDVKTVYINIGEHKFFNDEQKQKIAKIFQKNEFIKNKYEYITKSDFTHDYHQILSFLLLEYLIAKFNLGESDENITDFFVKYIFNFIFELCTKINSLTSMIFTKNKFANNNVFPVSIYNQINDKFDETKREIEKVFDIDTEQSVEELLQEFIFLMKNFIEELNRVKNRPKNLETSPGVIYNKKIEFEIILTNYFGDKFYLNKNFFEKIGLNIDQNNRSAIYSSEKDLNNFLSILKLGNIDNIMFYLKDFECNSFGKISLIIEKIKLALLKKYSKIENINDYDNKVIEYLKNSVIVSSMVEYYSPYSIDYFMKNIEFFAPYEFKDFNGLPLDNNKKANRKNLIHKYTKFIIANRLISNSFITHREAVFNNDNYIKRLNWLINTNAEFCNKTTDKFLLENVNIISFNYDSLFLTLQYEYLDVDLCNKFFKNNYMAMYGLLFLKDINEKINWQFTNFFKTFKKDTLWKCLFLFKENKNFVNIEVSHKTEQTIVFKDIFSQIDKCINWIEKDKKTREKSIKKFLQFNEIYFLGFGFDINNLYNLGIIDKNNKLSSKLKNKETETKIYISSGTPKIISILKDIFVCENVQSIQTLTTMQSKNYKFYISKNHSFEALKEDF